MKYSTVKALVPILAAVAIGTGVAGTLTVVSSPIGGLGWFLAGLGATVLEHRLKTSALFRVPTTYPEKPLPSKLDVRLITGPLARDFVGSSQVKIEGNIEYVLVHKLDGLTEWIPTAALGGTEGEKKYAAVGTHLPNVVNLVVPMTGRDPHGIFANKTLADWVGWDGSRVSKTWEPRGLGLVIPICNDMVSNRPVDFKYVDANNAPLKGEASAYAAAGKKVYYSSMRIVVDTAGNFISAPLTGFPPIEAIWD